MNELSNTIYDYFLAHFEELPLDKQLHFASRLWLWRNDQPCRELLDRLRPVILPGNDLAQTLSGIESGGLLPLHLGSASLNALRAPHLERYPQLRMSSRLLYWATVLGAVYDLDPQPAVEKVLAASELQTLADALKADHPALAKLSTHAVNFLYLYHRIILEDETFPTADFWSDIAADTALFEATDVAQRQLQLYLLTHAVIGESCFYQRSIPANKTAGNRTLVEQVETVMKPTLSSVNLDNKLEFLVCCQLVGYTSELESAILTEVEQSVSPNGAFLIDAHNANQQQAFASFDKSEHRSVLYLMATSKRSF